MRWLRRLAARQRKAGGTSHVPPASVSVTPPAAPRFDLRKLGRFVATDLNNHGQVVGYFEGKPMIWDSKDGLRVLFEPQRGEGVQTSAMRINDRGQVLIQNIKEIFDENGASRWIADSELWFEGTLTKVSPRGSSDLNEKGQVACQSGAGRELVTYLWEDGEMSQVGPKGFCGTFLNNHGHLAGHYYRDNDSYSLPATWKDGVLRVYDQFEGDIPMIEDINDAGQFVVIANQAWLVTDKEQIDVIKGDIEWVETGRLNSKGWCVGTYAYPREIPYVYGETAYFFDGEKHWLNTFFKHKYAFNGAVAINDRNQIVAYDEENVMLLSPRA